MGVFSKFVKKQKENSEPLAATKHPKKPIKVSEYSAPTLIVKNSYTRVEAFPSEIAKEIHKLLTYVDEGIALDVRRTYKAADYHMSKGNTRMAYMLKGKAKELKAKEVTHWYKDGKFPTGHLEMVIEHLSQLRFTEYDLIDRRVKPDPSVILKLFKNLPEPRYYQKEAVEACIKGERGVIEAAVGVGKTLTAIMLIKKLSMPTLVIVPSTGLSDQWEEELKEYFGPKAKAYDAKKIRAAKGKYAPIRIVTIQSISSLKKSDELAQFLEDVDCVILDEFHHGQSASYTNLLEDIDHVYYRIGLTGSFLVNTGSELAMKGVLSKRLYYYPATQAVKDGYLTPSKYLVTELEGRSHPDYQKQYDLNYCSKKVKGKTVGGAALRGAILNLVQNKIPENEQIFILVDRKDDSGAIIHEYLKLHGIANTFITGDTKKDERKQIIDAYNDKKIRIMIGSAVVGEGIDIRSSQHLILANGGKSPIKIIQNIGRVVRLCAGKDMSYIYDFYFKGANFLEKHCRARIENYQYHFGGEVVWAEE